MISPVTKFCRVLGFFCLVFVSSITWANTSVDWNWVKAQLQQNTLQRDLPRGKHLYQTYCQSCHFPDSNGVNLGSFRAPVGLKNIAQDNPLSFVETLLYGDTEAQMPRFAQLQLQEAIDILYYLRSL